MSAGTSLLPTDFLTIKTQNQRFFTTELFRQDLSDVEKQKAAALILSDATLRTQLDSAVALPYFYNPAVRILMPAQEVANCLVYYLVQPALNHAEIIQRVESKENAGFLVQSEALQQPTARSVRKLFAQHYFNKKDYDAAANWVKLLSKENFSNDELALFGEKEIANRLTRV